MAIINIAARQIHCKVVYYGPSMSGKTANLLSIHRRLPAAAQQELSAITTGTEPTRFFDCLPLDLGAVDGFQARFHVYAVPGKVAYGRSRAALLHAVDGIVFVADSQRQALAANLDSMAELVQQHAQNGKDAQDLPVVLQYNKRDLHNILPVEELDQHLNQNGWLRLEASAVSGAGVLDTLKSISKLVLSRL